MRLSARRVCHTWTLLVTALVVGLAPGTRAEDEEASPLSETDMQVLLALRDRIEARLTKVREDFDIDDDELDVPKAPDGKRSERPHTEPTPLPEEQEFPKAPQGIAVEVPGSEGPSGFEFLISPAVMKQMVTGDLRRVDFVRRQLAEAAADETLPEAVRVHAEAAREQWESGVRAIERLRTPLVHRMRIRTGENLRRLKDAARLSQAGVSAGQRRAAAVLAESALGAPGASTSAPTARPLGFTSMPPAAVAPSLDIPPPNRVRIQPRAPGATFRPRGVKIAIDEVMLARVLRDQTSDGGVQEILALEDAVLQAKDGVEALQRLQSFSEAKKAAFLERFVAFRGLGTPRIVSLARLVEEARRHRSRWAERPEALRTVGGLTRIHGFVRHAVTGELLLVGRTVPGDPPIHLDDLSVGMRSVWREGRTPMVSLDPDPGALSGLQYTRVGGVPGDSPFALAMLEADYRMKNVLFESKGHSPEIPGYRSWIDVRFETGDKSTRAARFWFYPVQPTSGSIVLGPGGSSALFDAHIELLTEDELTAQTSVTGAGTSHRTHFLAARSFTEHYDAIAEHYDEFERLRGLFDIAMLARILRLLAPGDGTLAALSRLPYDPVVVPKGYLAVRADHVRDDRGVTAIGGCDMGVKTPWRTMMEGSSKAHALLIDAASAAAVSCAGRDLDGVTLQVPIAGTGTPEDERHFDGALRFLQDGRLEEAEEALTRAIRVEPSFAAAYALRATIRAASGRQRAALWDAAQAVSLEPADTRLQAVFYRLLFESGLPNAFEGASGEVQDAIAQTYHVSAQLHQNLALQTGDARHTAIAEDLVTQALRVRPDRVESLLLRASLHGMRDELYEVLRDANRVLVLDPKNARAHLQMAMVHQQRKHYLKAAKALTTALELNRSDPGLRAACLEGRARVRLLRENFFGAGEDATQAIEFMATYWRPYATRGLAVFNMASALPKDPGDEETVRKFVAYAAVALDDIEKALRLGPPQDTAFQTMALQLLPIRDALRKILER